MKLLFRIWIYILKKTQEIIEEKRIENKEDIWVVTDSGLDQYFICGSVDDAKKLYDALVIFNQFTKNDRKVMYGKIQDIFKNFSPKISKFHFCCTVPLSEKNIIYDKIIDGAFLVK